MLPYVCISLLSGEGNAFNFIWFTYDFSMVLQDYFHWGDMLQFHQK